MCNTPPPFSRDDNISVADCMSLSSLLKTIKINGDVQCRWTITGASSCVIPYGPFSTVYIYIFIHQMAATTYKSENKNTCSSVDIVCNRQCCKKTQQKAQLSQRDRVTARCFVLLNISLIHSRTLKIIGHATLENDVSTDYYFVVTVSVYRTVSQVHSVKQWRDLET